MLREAWIGIIGLAVALSLPRPATAQVRASEAATVSQTVDGTNITITYSRPQVRGRDSLFGKVVHFGDTWTPGANWATTIEVSKDVQVAGTTLPEGKYSMWMVPQAGDWTVILDPDERRFHTQRPGESTDQIRITVTPGEGPYVEPADTHTFTPAFQKGGVILDVETEMKVVFQVQDGTATGFDMLGVRDSPMGKAKRAP